MLNTLCDIIYDVVDKHGVQQQYKYIHVRLLNFCVHMCRNLSNQKNGKKWPIFKSWGLIYLGVLYQLVYQKQTCYIDHLKSLNSKLGTDKPISNRSSYMMVSWTIISHLSKQWTSRTSFCPTHGLQHDLIVFVWQTMKWKMPFLHYHVQFVWDPMTITVPLYNNIFNNMPFCV